MYYAKDTVEALRESKEIVIYGARIVANEVANCLMGAPYHFPISGFMVSNMQGNPESLLGLPVIDIEEGKKKYQDATIVVAVLERYLDEILETLDKEGFTKVIPMGFESDLWSEIRGNYYKEIVKGQGREYLTLEEELEKVTTREGQEKVNVYMAKCHVDRKLTADFSKYAWETPIQVGAALTDQIISDVRDNIGENISDKNKQYCELTALYWIWKNDKMSRYAGLCHYRRHFCMTEENLKQLAASDIDVVVTIPILNFPSVREAYEHDHVIADWDTMLRAIELLAPEYRETAEKVQQGRYYYAYNMFIAKKEIFDAYCEWLFPILEYCEKNCGAKENTYQARYIGFLAERLLSIYVTHHQEEWKVVHAKKEFYVG